MGAVSPIQEAREKLRQAEELRKRGNFDHAETICTGLIRRYPDYVAALHTLGLVYADRKKPAQAVAPLFRAAMLNPKGWRTLTALSGVCLELEAPRMAAEILEQARRLNAQDSTVLITLAEIYRNEREYELAAKTYREAVEADPEYGPARLGLAHTCLSLGNDAEASALLNGLLKGGARSIGLLSALTELPELPTEFNLLNALDQVVRPANEHPEDFKASVAFARAAVLDKLGRYGEAWEALQTSNKIRFVAVQTERGLYRQHEIASLAKVKRNRSRIKGPVSDKVPITLLILGPSRAGKSSIEKLVGMSSDVKRGYENLSIENSICQTFQEAGLLTSWDIEKLPPEFHSAVRDLYREELSMRAASAKVFTNTNPGHVHSIVRLATILPNLRCLFIKRDIEDVTLRIFMRNYLVGNPYAYDLGTIREHVGWYYEMMDAIAEQMPDQTCVLSYETMIANPPETLRRISQLCGLQVTSGAMPKLGDDRGCATPYKDMLNS